MNIYDPLVATESRQFCGTTHWYKHLLGIVYTDGVKWLAEKLQCHWLVDDIAFYSQPFWKREHFFYAEFTTPKKRRGYTQYNGWQ